MSGALKLGLLGALLLPGCTELEAYPLGQAAEPVDAGFNPCTALIERVQETPYFQARDDAGTFALDGGRRGTDLACFLRPNTDGCPLKVIAVDNKELSEQCFSLLNPLDDGRDR